jgi:phosphatidate cytidylyltransferase
MKQGVARIVTAVAGIPLVLGLVWLGGWFFYGLICVIALLAMYELVRMMHGINWPVSIVWSLILGACVLLRPVVSDWEAWMLGATLVFAVFQLRTGPDRWLERMAGTVMGAVYPVLFISFLIDLHWGASDWLGSSAAFTLILMLLCLIWGTDTGAYYTGKTFGKHKLAPSISPNKTWEGSVGGLALAFGVASLFKLFFLPELTWMDAAVLAVLGGVWGQMGDLMESALKRHVGVKDSGAMLPGHGGMLDRFDSLIFTAPAYYIYLVYISDLIGG